MKKSILVILIYSLMVTMFARAGEEDAASVDFKKPILYSGSLMLIGYGILVSTGEVDKPGINNFKEAFKDGPAFDNSPVYYNFILHPLWGSETYLRARECNFGMLGSIGFSLCASLTWEFLIESWSERPSSNDLIVTTGIGWMLGEVRYEFKKASQKKKHWLIDPINTLLEHLEMNFMKDGAGKVNPVMARTWDF